MMGCYYYVGVDICCAYVEQLPMGSLFNRKNIYIFMLCYIDWLCVRIIIKINYSYSIG